MITNNIARCRYICACTGRRSIPAFCGLVIAAAFLARLVVFPRCACIAQSRPNTANAVNAMAPAIEQAVPCNITIRDNRNQPLKRFDPLHAFGAGVDGLDHGDVDKVYTAANIKAMLSAGFKPLTYRLRTELGIEAWHWNPQGKWSDAVHQQGYWTSSSRSSGPIVTCYGYQLPRRGNTIDQANNSGYSRILDDDPETFWKSNPYLDRHFTGDNNSVHPQWIVLDLGKLRSIDSVRVLWGRPYASSFVVEFCTGAEPNGIFDSSPLRWRRFSNGMVTHGVGGNQLLRLCATPQSARYVRIMLLRSSGAGPHGSTDIRDSLGFAVREIYLGVHTSGGRGQIQDWLRHGRKATSQSTVYVSSTDPWHRSSDIDLNTEQPGLDRVITSGLTNGLPMMVPIAPLYDTPDNAAQMIRYLRWRHCPLRQVEVGEEPDGQNILPEDYAALYVQFANAVLRVDPTLKLGGPGLQTSVEGYRTWADSAGNSSWLNRFLGYLRTHGRMRDFAFFSFEWYPFDDILGPPKPEAAAGLLRRTFHQFELDGIPRTVPWIITEYGYSSSAGQPEAELPGALVNTETAAEFLSLGGDVTFYYGYEPNTLMNEAPPAIGAAESWGNLTLFLADDSRNIKAPLATYYAARMLTQEWAQPGDGPHRLYSASTDLLNERGEDMVSAYPLLRPDGFWSVLILNKDPARAVNSLIRFVDGTGQMAGGLIGNVEIIQYSAQQYVWHANGRLGYAQPNEPPSHVFVRDPTTVILPAYSITVVRGAGPH